MQKEAKARIKINKLFEQAGWRFFDDEKGKANIVLELNTKITKKDIDEFGNDFEKTKNGYIDFLLLNEKGFPIVILEAKSEDKNPLDGKEQARSYAKSQNVRFVILSNGNLHYFWDLESGNPTFRYSLIDGVKEGYLVNPVVVDARTDITTELLSEEGYSVMVDTEEGKEVEMLFFQKDFEKKFYSEETNRVFCKTFMENALKDPISGEIGKSIVYCVSQYHASKITQILNEFADLLYPSKYKSDFSVQVTSTIPDAQQFSINFSDKNNNLNGRTEFLEGYKSSKTRVCVTVGMMTTGYDCQDILNLCMMRPIFSPTDFIQIR